MDQDFLKLIAETINKVRLENDRIIRTKQLVGHLVDANAPYGKNVVYALLKLNVISQPRRGFIKFPEEPIHFSKIAEAIEELKRKNIAALKAYREARGVAPRTLSASIKNNNPVGIQYTMTDYKVAISGDKLVIIDTNGTILRIV